MMRGGVGGVGAGVAAAWLVKGWAVLTCPPVEELPAPGAAAVLGVDPLRLEDPVEPEVDPVVEPVTEPVVEPVTEPVVEPVVEPVTEPPLVPAAEPVVEPVPAEPAPEAEPCELPPVAVPEPPAVPEAWEPLPPGAAVEDPVGVPVPEPAAPADEDPEPDAAGAGVVDVKTACWTATAISRATLVTACRLAEEIACVAVGTAGCDVTTIPAAVWFTETVITISWPCGTESPETTPVVVTVPPVVGVPPEPWPCG